MKRLVVALGPCVAMGCIGVAVDVGSSPVSPPASAPPDASDAAADVAPEAAPDPLATCGASGVVDRYDSAKDLTTRLVGRWGQCPEVTNSPLPCSPNAPLWGIKFAADGTYALLGADGAGGDYDVQPEPCGTGTFKIYAPESVDASSAGRFVALDDPTPHNGLEVHLFPAADGGLVDVELVEFESKPVRMLLREKGLDSRGYFAPLPPRLR